MRHRNLRRIRFDHTKVPALGILLSNTGEAGKIGRSYLGGKCHFIIPHHTNLTRRQF